MQIGNATSGLHNTAYLIGNGLSRKGLDLETLRGRGHIIGCNWLFCGGWPGKPLTDKPFIPDTLVTIDSPPQDEIRRRYGTTPPFYHLAQNVQRTHVLLNRSVLCGRPDGPYWNNSGVFGAWYACEYLKVDRLYLVGVDFFRPVEGDTNDMYGIYTVGVTIQVCFNKLAEQYTDTEFIRIGPTADDAEWYSENISPRIKLQEALDI
jgi:hypothetical protein